MHGEDLYYMYRTEEQIVGPQDEAFMIRARYVRLLSNFIRYGNPTPMGMDPLFSVSWLRTETDEFMNMGRFLVMQDNPSPDSFSVWSRLDQKYRKY